jgi:hypothetical protein
MGLGWVMVFNAIFNNISIISWRSVLLVEETGVPRENAFSGPPAVSVRWASSHRGLDWTTKQFFGQMTTSYFWEFLTLTLCDKVCQWVVAVLWFSLGTPVSSTNKTDLHDITEIFSMPIHVLWTDFRQLWLRVLIVALMIGQLKNKEPIQLGDL